MPRVPLVLALVLALASPAAATETDGSMLDHRLKAMLAAQPPVTTAALDSISGIPRRDPWAAAAWSAMPAVGMLLLGTAMSLGNQAVRDASIARQDAAGIPPVDQTYDALPLADLSLLPGLTPVAFGGGQFYAGDPLRGTLVTLAGPLVTLLGFFTGMMLTAVIPETPLAPGEVRAGRGLVWGMTGGIVACTAFGLWSTWDALQLVEQQNQAPAP